MDFKSCQDELSVLIHFYQTTWFPASKADVEAAGCADTDTVLLDCMMSYVRRQQLSSPRSEGQ